MCADTVLGQTMAELATRSRDPNGSRKIQFGSRDSNFPGINIPNMTVCLNTYSDYLCVLSLYSQVQSCLQVDILNVHIRMSLNISYIVTVLQCNRLNWHGHVLRKDQKDSVERPIDYYEVNGVKPRQAQTM